MHATQPLSILFLQTDTNIGGTEMMNFRVWHTLTSRGHQVDVCCLDGRGPLHERYREAAYEPIYLGSKNRSALHVLRDLRRLLREKQYDLVHIFGLRANLFGRIAALTTPYTHIITGQRSIDSWRKPYHNALDRLTGHRVAHYIANSRVVAAWLHTTLHIAENRISIVYSGIDATPFSITKQGMLRSELGIPPGALLMTCVASLRPAKGHKALFEALPALQSTRSLHLILVGDVLASDTLSRSDYEALVPDSNCTVHFLSHRNDIPAILVDSDIAVLPSRWEGLPGFLMEAMAAGLPVVATDVGGVPELVVNGATGLLVPTDDSAELAAALNTMLNSPDLRAQMGAAGQTRIQRLFSLEQSVLNLEKVYQAVVQQTERGTQIAV